MPNAPGGATRPAWWASSSTPIKQAAQVFFVLLGRWPDQATAQSMAQRQGIAGAGAYVVGAGGSEFLNRVTAMGGSSPTGWVTALYRIALLREPDAGGLNFYVSNWGVGEVHLALDVVSSVEFAQDITRYAAA